MEHRLDIDKEFKFCKVNDKYSDEDFKRKKSIRKTRYKTWDGENESDYLECSSYWQSCKITTDKSIFRYIQY